MSEFALLTRRAAAYEALRLSRLADGADPPASDLLWARANALVSDYELDWIDLVRRPRTGHPLLLISAGGLNADLRELREAICNHVRVEIERRRRPEASEDYLRLAICVGARWRRGSNSWRPNAMRQLRDERQPETPCPNCGADGDNLGGADGYESCSACGVGFAVGDYAWDNLADVLRYGADAAAGDVEDINRCRRCDRLYDQAMMAVHLGQSEPFCVSPGCPWGGDLPLFDPFAEPAPDSSTDVEAAA